MIEIPLDQRKSIAYSILCKIDEVCKNKGINYYLAYGTLIGAIRHNGFIPWDDDIDIWVPIKQYKYFLDSIKDASNYEVLSPIYDDITWNRSFSKISDASTIIKRTDGRPTEKRGISVDVFPLFKIYDEEWLKNVQKCDQMLERFGAYRAGVYNDFKEGYNFLKYFYFNCAGLFKKDENYWKRKLWALQTYDRESSFIGCPTSPYRDKDCYLVEWFFNSSLKRFEDRDFPVPIGYDRVLKSIYGNYMELPPIEKRVSNHEVIAFIR